jgi:hypothetical protein
MVRKFFSSCLAIIFVPIFVVTILVIGAKYDVFNPNFYLNVFDKSNFYTEVVQNLPNILGQSLTGGDNNAFGPLTGEDIASSIQESINPTWLKNNLQNTITSIFNYGSGKIYSIDVIIPLKDIKLSFINSISQKFNTKIAALPQCTDQQFQELQSKNLSPTSLNCIPSGTNIEKLENQFKNDLTSGDQSLMNTLPDNYNLNEQLNKNPLLLSNIKKAFSYSNTLFYVLLITSLLLLTIIALINMKNVSTMLKWISIPILISAILLLISAIFGNLILNSMASGFIIDSTAQVKSFIFNLIGTITKQFFSFYYYCSSILIILSIITIVIAIKISNKTKTLDNPKPEVNNNDIANKK